MTTTRAVALTLYRNLMKQATTMSDYNFRSYAIRRVRVGYHKNRTSTGYVHSPYIVWKDRRPHNSPFGGLLFGVFRYSWGGLG